MNANDADLADESAFESQYSPDNDSIYSTQASILSLHGSACSDNLSYGPSLPSSPPKVQRKYHFIYGRTYFPEIIANGILWEWHVKHLMFMK